MRTDLKSRLGRASAAIAVGLVALAGVASTANAQNWNGWIPNNGYNNSQYPYYNRSWDRGWTWGERYGAPPNAYYSAPGYYAPQGYYPPPASYPPAYGANPQAALSQMFGLFVR
jgi:hypothetical protein